MTLLDEFRITFGELPDQNRGGVIELNAQIPPGHNGL